MIERRVKIVVTGYDVSFDTVKEIEKAVMLIFDVIESEGRAAIERYIEKLKKEQLEQSKE